MCDVAPVHPDIEATAKGLTTAIRACGAWPVSGELADFVIAAQRAEAEVDRAVETWQRWRRRFAPVPANALDLATERTNIRQTVALVECEHRRECVRLLLGPMSGQA
jgi:hypothetical protein